ncbi:unnamed protein product [Angiostrongylus costaricensis]|uniref:AA_TRNA_LIGASE_II domain-containing protein n=1 Tax=Angiostrongylus costaricensis TaxID=334426 RepID=A0A158PKD8_ANGCS|nr:unnamed protein product [Angiostrongylus costaricensis]
MNRFIVLRDAYGTVQAVIDPESPLSKIVKDLHYESVLRVEGAVLSRGNNVNPMMKTGEIEINVSKLMVLNHASSNLPMLPDSEASEKTRFTYRYIDLRSDRMQRALRLRSTVVHKMRRFLIEEAKFVDVETPTLFRRTPGGAAEFIVPAPPPQRGLCYTLPQSPQQFKQLLMIGAIDRYFQGLLDLYIRFLSMENFILQFLQIPYCIARCYRDEGSKGDRQPEFTQVDLELSFTTQDGVMALVEETLMSAWPEHLVNNFFYCLVCSLFQVTEEALLERKTKCIHHLKADLKPPTPFPRLNYNEAMQNYGSDKPDMRIPWRIQDCTQTLDFLRSSNVSYDWVARLIVCKGQLKVNRTAVKKEFKRILDMNKLSRPFAIFDRTKDVWFKKIDKNELVTRFLIDEEDCVVFSWGDEEGVQWTLGQLRNFVADAGELRKQRKASQLICAHWIVNFPLFSVEDDKLVATHHPFTAPIEEHKQWLDDSTKISNIVGERRQHYDLVMNGVELGGGSIRIHNSKEQAKVLEILGQDTQEMSHLLDALSFGSPPHGGFALGLDRYIALLVGEGDPSVPVRDVIAFPKSKEGRDFVSQAPVPPTDEQLKRYGVQFVEEENLRNAIMFET